LSDNATRAGPLPSPLRHRPELRPPQEIFTVAPADDDNARRRCRWRPRGRTTAALVAIVAAVITVAGRHDPAPSAPPTTTTSAAPTTVGFADGGPCPSIDDGTVVRGNGPGGTDTGAHAILGFDYAYYVLRDAAAARAFVTPTSIINPVDQLQAGIRTAPNGTEHCLNVTADGPDHYRVELTTRHGRDDLTTYRQIVTTVTVGAQVLIAAIAPAPQ
jgi:hypothetical protein